MTATDISSFFTESDSSMGLFYPLHCILAVYPTPQAAVESRNALLRFGVDPAEALALSPTEALTFLQQFREKSGIPGDVSRSVSRFLGDDTSFADRDIDNARLGCGFLFVHAKLASELKNYSEIAKSFQPFEMRYYRDAAIESLL